MSANFFKICWPPKFMSAKCLKTDYPRQLIHLKYSNYTPDKVSLFLPMLSATTIASSLSLHHSGKTTLPLSSRRFNWRSAYLVSNSSRTVHDIPWPYLCDIDEFSIICQWFDGIRKEYTFRSFDLTMSLHKLNLEKRKASNGINVDYLYLYIFHLIAFAKNNSIFRAF